MTLACDVAGTRAGDSSPLGRLSRHLEPADDPVEPSLPVSGVDAQHRGPAEIDLDVTVGIDPGIEGVGGRTVGEDLQGVKIGRQAVQFENDVILSGGITLVISVVPAAS